MYFTILQKSARFCQFQRQCNINLNGHSLGIISCLWSRQHISWQKILFLIYTAIWLSCQHADIYCSRKNRRPYSAKILMFSPQEYLPINISNFKFNSRWRMFFPEFFLRSWYFALVKVKANQMKTKFASNFCHKLFTGFKHRRRNIKQQQQWRLTFSWSWFLPQFAQAGLAFL